VTAGTVTINLAHHISTEQQSIIYTFPPDSMAYFFNARMHITLSVQPVVTRNNVQSRQPCAAAVQPVEIQKVPQLEVVKSIGLDVVRVAVDENVP
jgi:hypothetical protein